MLAQTDNVESTLLFHPPTPDNVDRIDIQSYFDRYSQLLYFTVVIGWDCILIQYLNSDFIDLVFAINNTTKI
jgi:hypothetical protein